MERIRVLVCRNQQEPVVEEIQDGPGSMQRMVGGFVECLEIEPGVDLWSNEEAVMLGLPFNRRFAARAPQVAPGFFVIKLDEDLADPGQMGYHTIRGDFFLAGHDGEGGTVSLAEEQLKKFTRIFGLRCASCSLPLEYSGAVYCGPDCAAAGA